MKLFKSCKFDSSDAIFGIDLADTTNGRDGLFNFIIDNSKDLAELKKSWIFKDAARSQRGQKVFKVFYTRNKVVKRTWVIFPEAFCIATDEGAYLFDVSMLTKLHSKSPLVYRVRTDTLGSRDEFIKFYDSVKAISSFLYLNEPDVGEGSFEVKLKAATKNVPEDIGLRIIDICNEIKPKTAFRVYFKNGEEAVDSKSKTYVVRCDRSLFEQFSYPDMEKGEWAPATYIIQSYWRK
ncbi:hypothetical protein [Niastella vici]|uniref:hypothetical protein n=1 Tax=Niastella vici TaxID=1703345 RepID=UPI00117C3BB6|nr:hypothetical protein [Niastella vici]